MNNSIYVIEKKLLTSDRDRFVNCILDFIFIVVAMFVFTLLIIIIGNILQFSIYRIWTEIAISLGIPGFYLSFSMFYYLVLEWLLGRSIGKFITGSTVVNKNGLKPGFGEICIRTLCRLIPFDALSFLGKSGRIWHDSLSNTYVVEKKALEEDIKMFYEFNLIGVQETDL
ncbi:RDD family protein [Flavobacterium sp. ANB]|nr:RDD family protein [Flavobacterium sp. ANB]MTD68180.1 RDD family protein [Flavobacterium sp. LC2016-13]